MSPDLDANLVQACQAALATAGQAGLEGPFRELYEQYKDRVYNVCFRISGNAPDALDASQETFGILFRKLPDFRFQSKFSSWVYRIAVNASIDLRRRSKRLTSLEGLTQDQGRQSAGGAGAPHEIEDERVELPVAAMTRRELEHQIQGAIDRLSPKLRAITVLRYIEALSYEEISETLQVSLGTVKSRLARAHDSLDRELTPILDRYHVGESDWRTR
ncbi:MAG: sigma-70 family RNA polymerase sigma factor [Planctomycetota bacterium]